MNEDRNQLLDECMQDTDNRVEVAMLVHAMRISEGLEALRTGANLSQAELAEMVGTKQSQISRFENGNYTGFSVRALTKITDALGAELFISPLKKEEADLCRAALRGELVPVHSAQQVYKVTQEILDHVGNVCEMLSQVINSYEKTRATNKIVNFPVRQIQDAV